MAILPSDTQPIVCMAVQPDAEVIDAFGNVYNCTETPYVPVYNDSEYLMGNIQFPPESIHPKKDRLVTWNQDLSKGEFPCASCPILPICGGACPKQWHESISPCPSIKYNLKDRLLIYTQQALSKQNSCTVN